MLERKVANTLVQVKFKEVVQSPFDDFNQSHIVNKYIVRCHNVSTGKKISFPFFDSINNTLNKRVEHDELMNSILECVSMDYFTDRERYPTFEDFAHEFGYDVDSRKAERTYKDCIKLANKLQSVFTVEDIKTMGF